MRIVAEFSWSTGSRMYAQLESKANDPRWCVRFARLSAYKVALDDRLESKPYVNKAVEVIVRAIDGESVDNIRLLAMEMLGAAHQVADDALVRSTIRPQLERMAKDDKDDDVRHFAQKAFAALG